MSRELSDAVKQRICEYLPEAEERSLPAWKDARVQAVYKLLVDDKVPRDNAEHWEGFAARRIVAGLAAAPPRERHSGISYAYERLRNIADDAEMALCELDGMWDGAATTPRDSHPVAWIATSPSGNVLHMSAADGWNVETVVVAAQDQPSEAAGEAHPPCTGAAGVPSLDPSPASTLSPEDAELLRWLSLYASDWPDHDNGFDATASRLREVLAELAEERRQHNMSCADAHEALDKAEAELAAVRAERDALATDAARWRLVRNKMTHERSGPNFGWCVSELIPGDDPDAAIDAALKAKP